MLLRREGGHVLLDENLPSIRGWRADQVLASELFDYVVDNDPAGVMLAYGEHVLHIVFDVGVIAY